MRYILITGNAHNWEEGSMALIAVVISSFLGFVLVILALGMGYPMYVAVSFYYLIALMGAAPIVIQVYWLPEYYRV